ncbi:hypothetical protein OC846_006821 [Tilletia horrida]|uniref:Uncharacterized protein n=1 Tax=Tilletia horrida TaxID=155126 RepID=A0AAN6GIP6_9BASI|nr:hypothetical protein OC845_006935 [Tilletia horrida]KAK0542170.1 hypothetical protein OC846_006821 [Tilletia horrida]KAK0560474.1 hypothetical protein OC861_006270 [Tilletia horrida]
MPRLQQEVKEAKYNYLNDHEGCTVSRFSSKQCPSVKVLALRQAAGAMSYLNDGVTRTEFLAIHQCVSAAWDSWHADYIQ